MCISSFGEEHSAHSLRFAENAGNLAWLRTCQPSYFYWITPLYYQSLPDAFDERPNRLRAIWIARHWERRVPVIFLPVIGRQKRKSWESCSLIWTTTKQLHSIDTAARMSSRKISHSFKVHLSQQNSALLIEIFSIRIVLASLVGHRRV